MRFPGLPARERRLPYLNVGGGMAPEHCLQLGQGFLRHLARNQRSVRLKLKLERTGLSYRVGQQEPTASARAVIDPAVPGTRTCAPVVPADRSTGYDKASSSEKSSSPSLSRPSAGTSPVEYGSERIAHLPRRPLALFPFSGRFRPIEARFAAK